jgi:hypothetical protein
VAIFDVPWFRGEASGGDLSLAAARPSPTSGRDCLGTRGGAQTGASSPLSLTLSPKGRGDLIFLPHSHCAWPERPPSHREEHMPLAGAPRINENAEKDTRFHRAHLRGMS